MKHQSLQKLFAFIITMIMFFAMPQVSNAQKKGHICPTCYRWYKGDCVPCRGCCMLSVALSSDEPPSVSLPEPSAINFPLSDKGPVSIKIYDITGRLVKTIANGKMSEDYHEVEWDNKDESGKPVPAGIYVLQIAAHGKSETMKISIIK